MLLLVDYGRQRYLFIILQVPFKGILVMCFPTKLRNSEVAQVRSLAPTRSFRAGKDQPPETLCL